MRDFGEGVGQDIEALRRAVLAVRQLLGGMRPVARQAARDGVRGVAYENVEVVPRTVSRIQPFAFGNADHRSAGPDGDALAERFVAPAQADHVVELGPVQEGVVGGVKYHQAASAADVSFQRLFHFARPASAVGRVPAVEIVDHHIVMAEVRRRGPGGNSDREASRTFEDALDGAGARRPIVVVHTIDHECRKFRAGGGGTGKREHSCQEQSKSHRVGTRSFDDNRSRQIWWGGRPRPRGSPWTRCLCSSDLTPGRTPALPCSRRSPQASPKPRR